MSSSWKPHTKHPKKGPLVPFSARANDKRTHYTPPKQAHPSLVTVGNLGCFPFPPELLQLMVFLLDL